MTHWMKMPRFLRSLSKRTNRDKDRARRLERIEALGFQVTDRSGWFEGKFASRRYILERDGVELGVYLSSREALQAAEDWIAQQNAPSNPD